MKNLFKNETFRLILIILIIISVWIATGVLTFKFINNWEHRGQFGDLFGSINSLFSGLAFSVLIYTFYMQKKDSTFQKVKIIEQNNTMIDQMLDTNFFSLIEIYHKIIDKLTVPDIISGNKQEKDCFLALIQNLEHKRILKEFDNGQNHLAWSSEEKPIEKEIDETERLELMKQSYFDFIKDYQQYYFHYLQFIKLIFNFISDNDKKNYYQNIFISLLYKEEVKFLFYISFIDKEIKKYFMKYNMINFLSENDFKVIKFDLVLIKKIDEISIDL